MGGNLFLALLLAAAIPVTQGDVTKQFTVKKSFETVANHIQNETDDLYHALGAEVLSRNGNEVTVAADTPMGRIQFVQTEKITRTQDSVSLTLTSNSDTYKFYSKLVATPGGKRGTSISIEVRLSISNEQATPALIEMGINKVINKIKKHLKTFGG